MDHSSDPYRAATPQGATAGELFRALARALLLAAALVVVLWFTYAVRQAVLLLILAAIVSLVLNAPVTWLARKGVSRALGGVLVILLILLVAGGVGYLLVPRLLQELPTLVEEVPRMVRSLGAQASQLLGGAPEVDRQLSQLVAWVERGLGEVWRFADTVAAALFFLLFTLAMVLYIVSDPRPIVRWYVQTAPPRTREAAVRAFHRASRMVVGWVLANAILGGVKAVSVFVFLTLMDVPGALLWSIPALFAALIPRLGFYLMSAPPLLASLAVSTSTALWTALFLLALSEFLGNFVAPRVQGEIMELHPAYLLFMALAMGLAFGVLGVIVSGPVAGFLKVFYDEFYLARQAEDPRLDDHVERIMDGSLRGARQVKEVFPG